MEQRSAGLLLAHEVETLSSLLDNPSRPLVAVLGGAKVSDKIGVIESFQRNADTILIGGAMCFPFFAAQGHDVLPVSQGARTLGRQLAVRWR